MSRLITTIDELKGAVNVNRDTDLTGILPALDKAEALVARQLGGFALLDTLLALTQLTPAQERALSAMRRAVGSFAVLAALPSLNVQITDAGIQRTTSSNTGDAFQWQYDELKSSLSTDAWDALEDLLAILEETPADFAAWHASRPAPLLIPSARVFNQYSYIGERRLTYQALLPSLRAAEIRRIRPFLAYQHLTVDDLTAEGLELLRMALAYTTLAIALRERQIDITETGVQVLGLAETATSGTYRRPVEDQPRIDGLILHYETMTSGLLHRIIPISPLGLSTNPIISGRIVGF